MRWLCAIALALLVASSAIGSLQPVSGSTDNTTSGISIDPAGGLPRFLGDNVRLQWVVPGDFESTSKLRSLRYITFDEKFGDGIRRTVTSRESLGGRNLTHHYFLARTGAAADPNTVRIDLDIPAGAAVQLSGESGFVPEPLPGFGAFYGKVLAIVVDGRGQQKLESSAGTSVERILESGSWFGIRNRFWTGLIRSEAAPLKLRAAAEQENQPRLIAMTVGEVSRLRLELYAGPIESNRLVAVDPSLSGMMYAALWEWLRVLCFGMSWLLAHVQALVGNVGLSIILLSVCVKLLMLPLTRIADRWQDSVNKTAAILQPQIDAIKREHKGEDAHVRTLAVYRDHDVHPMYTVKSLAGFLILIPVFIAAFDVLGESFLLNGTSFLWAEDLAKPDRAFSLPWELPFFGAHLNLLPFLMTGVTLLTSWIQIDASLTPELLRKQRTRLYLVAVAFFLLFYTFPAGMVLYWTTNNVLHLLKIQVVRLAKGGQAAS